MSSTLIRACLLLIAFACTVLGVAITLIRLNSDGVLLRDLPSDSLILTLLGMWSLTWAWRADEADRLRRNAGQD